MKGPALGYQAITSVVVAFALILFSKEIRAELAPSGQGGTLPASLEKSDQNVMTCLADKSPKRIAAIISLDNAEKRVQDRLASLNLWLSGDRKKFDEQEFRKILLKIYSETEKDLLAHASPSGTDLALNSYRKVEASRVLAETAALLSLVSIPEKNISQEFKNKASENLNRGIQSLKEIDPTVREKQLPNLVAYLAKTDLNIAQLNWNGGEGKSDSEKWTHLVSTVQKYRDFTAGASQIRELDLVELEAAISLGDREVGGVGAMPYLTPSQKQHITRLRATVQKALDSPSGERHREKANHLLGISPFYFGDRVERDRALDKLKKQLSSEDLKTRQTSQAIAADLMRNLSGTSIGNQIFDLAKNSSSSKDLDNDLTQFTQQETQLAQDYQGSLNRVIGEEGVKKLGFASYPELIHSNGVIKSYQDDYAQSLDTLGEAAKKREKDSSSVQDEDIKGLAQSVDFKWAYLQCARRQLGMGSVADVERSPTLSYEINFSRCARVQGKFESLQIPTNANRAIDQAIQSQITKDLIKNVSLNALQLGEATFDYLWLLPAGGIASRLKGPTKILLNSFGKRLMRSRLLDPRLVKMGTRTATLATGVLVTDVTVQSSIAAREFVRGCLSGDCQLSKLPENFAYTQETTDPKGHAVRLFATAVASYGLDLLWGKLRGFSPTIVTRVSQNTAARTLGETLKGSVNMVVTESVGTVAESTVTGCDLGVISNLADEKTWFEAMKVSVLGQLKGSNRKSARYFSLTLLPRLFDMGITELTPEELKNIESCTLLSTEDGNSK